MSSKSGADSSRRTRRGVTSVDVAAVAGVSQATVGRVFSSPEKVSPATRDKVQDAAARLGYVPNVIARSLKSQRTNIIGAVVPAFGEYWQSVLTEFSRQLATKDRQLLLFSFAEPGDVDGVLASVAQYRLDGLVLASATIGQDQLIQMRESDRPVVAFNHPAATGIVPSVSVDNEAGMARLAMHLIDTGAREILYVGGVSSASTDQTRYRGASRTLGEHGVACTYLEAGAFTYEAGYKVAQHIVERQSVPDAVMVSSDEVAFGVHDGLRAAGVQVPADLLLTGFDGLSQSAWAGFDLTTLVQATDVLVARAIEILLADDRPPESDPVSVVVSGTIRYGKTTAKRHD
ncbi:MAG: LacI family transcriptional regulator [Acidimicrobiaceae bacterium]|nr:LacI family transcriptional regulator [Acidimicrobiaceae bacterium]MYG55834.1 LacI family transcriptional regulator [Acidimicrobiaceae bacterium]MYJ97909.1 LacI family transcriptional regulator [Acidimicrobiaceae bacterium]